MKRIVALVVVVVSLAACNKKAAPTASEKGDAASGAASDLPTATHVPAPKPLPDFLVDEGSVANEGFTLEFHVSRVEGDQGKTYREAVAYCRQSGRMLCTETQWIRACAQIPSVGSMESWTASRRGRSAVVRGGKDCHRRRKVEGGVTHPNRVGLCCERAVALRPRGDAGPLLGPGARLPLALEEALNGGNEEQLRELFAEQVVREGKEWTLDALLASEKASRDAVHWTLFDVCNLRSGPVIVDKDGARTGRLQGLILNCRSVIERKDDVVDYYTRFGLVQSEGEERYRIAQIEHKSTAVIPGAR